jgi:hypothetical protein
MEGRAGELNEYVIGVQALGQPAGYSPTENSAVRSRIHELRHRLDKFYSAEAPGAAIQIQLLKGTYVPRFARAEQAVAPVPASPSRIFGGARFLCFVTRIHRSRSAAALRRSSSKSARLKGARDRKNVPEKTLRSSPSA